MQATGHSKKTSTIVLVFIGNSKNFHFENIYPILGNGINATFFSGFSNVFAFCGLAYLFFLPSKLRNPEKLTKISIISVNKRISMQVYFY